MRRPLVFLLLGLLANGPGFAATKPPDAAPAPAKLEPHAEPGTNATPAADATIARYLRDNRAVTPSKATLTTNAPAPPAPADPEGLGHAALRPPATPSSDGASWHQREFERQLDVARQLRLKREFAQAVIGLVTLLESNAADDIKRPALMELSLTAQQSGQSLRAAQVLSQFVTRFPDDPQVPEALLRQGLLHRELGAHTLALAKFYAVLSSALTLKLERFPYYQRLVLQAQIEIADTFYLQGKYSEAAEYLARLLRLETAELDRARIQFKLMRALHAQGRHDEAIGQGHDFLKHHSDSSDVPELRFLLARSHKAQGRTRESLREVMLLMESQLASAQQTNALALAYWQQRAGNDIANQLYQEGDYLSALQVYEGLAQLDRSPHWQLPAWYQIGLIYERLRQPAKAIQSFAQILDREKELDGTASPALKTVLEMARWRKGHIEWQTRAEAAMPPAPPTPATNAPSKTAKAPLPLSKK